MLKKSALLFSIAFIGGSIAFLLGLPMPFMLGGLLGSAGFVLLYENDTREFGRLNPYIRMSAMAMTGTMIGASFRPDILQVFPLYWASLLMMLPFMLIAHFGGYIIMRRAGGYNKVDAYWASLPGGLVEAVLLGEKEGADVRILTAQHFIRILIIVIFIPIGFWVLTGEVVGSAAGESLGRASWHYSDIILIIIVALVGMVMGRFFKIPAGHLMGPMLLSLGLGVSGTLEMTPPPLGIASCAIYHWRGTWFAIFRD